MDFTDFGISKILGMCLEWLVEEVEKAITIKKEDMRAVRQGAVTTLEPKVIWVKAIDRPGTGLKLEDIREVNRKFNAILEETLYKTRNMYFMGIERQTIDRSCFDISGNLNNRGKINFWSEFDRQIKKFDKQELTLKPVPIITNPKNNKANK